jgi:hypothetical protein
MEVVIPEKFINSKTKIVIKKTEETDQR